MKRVLTSILAAVLLVGLVGLTGCGDDVKRVKKVETHHESEPVPVAPGEPVVR